MTCERPIEPIQSLVDGTLTGAARTELEAHLTACPECAHLLADLRRVRTAASSLPPMTPPPGVWERIESRLTDVRAPAPSWRRPAAPWLAAAATLLLALAGWWASARPPAVQEVAQLTSAPQDAAIAADGSAATAEGVTATAAADPTHGGELHLVEQQYQGTIEDLEQLARESQEGLDPAVSAALQAPIGAVDQAITESRAALREQPSSEPAQESLFSALRTKVLLLQDTITLINEMRKGNQAEAARIVEGLNANES